MALVIFSSGLGRRKSLAFERMLHQICESQIYPCRFPESSHLPWHRSASDEAAIEKAIRHGLDAAGHSSPSDEMARHP